MFETPISNFRRLIEQDLSDNFKINFDSSSEVKNFQVLTRNEARLISKNINDLCIVDPTIDEYILSIPNKDKKQGNEEYKEVLNLLIRSTREEVTIPKEKQKQFELVRFLLGEKEFSYSNYEDIQNIQEAISLLYTEMNPVAIQYLGVHLLELLQSGEAENLSDDIIYSIIDEFASIQAKPKQQQQEQDIMKIFSFLREFEEAKFVVHFILQMKIEEKSDKYTEMIEYLIENLDDEIVSNEIPKITNLIRWILEKKNNKNFFNNGKVTECHFSSDELNGIVSYMKKTFGNDLDENGSLKLSGGGSPNPSFPLSNLIQYDKFQINDFYSNDSSRKPSSETDSWIEFDFIDRRIKLTSYTMRTYANGKNSFYNPKSWRIVGSNDRKEWTVLDHEEDCSALNGSCKQHRFACDENDGYYRYIRYIQEDSWNISSCKYSFRLTCFEMFGSILEPTY